MKILVGGGAPGRGGASGGGRTIPGGHQGAAAPKPRFAFDRRVSRWLADVGLL